MSGLAVVACATLLVMTASGQPKPETPDTLNPPMDVKLVLQAHATGDQVYVCKADSKNQFAWTLKEPDATLFDSDGKRVGKHFAGPTWQWLDGSEVKAKLAASSPSPESDSIPWLLLTAIDHKGPGALRNVASIQRLHTSGGKAPASGCDAGRGGSIRRSRYAADYYFYARSGR
jgi:hypothetical protein